MALASSTAALERHLSGAERMQFLRSKLALCSLTSDPMANGSTPEAASRRAKARPNSACAA
eukprot:1741782-Rhodomonas_salina.1